MSFVVHMFADQLSPFTEGLPMLLLVNGEVFSKATTNSEGTLIFDCDVPPEADLAIRIDLDDERLNPMPPTEY
jgi:hypothetical protein